MKRYFWHFGRLLLLLTGWLFIFTSCSNLRRIDAVSWSEAQKNALNQGDFRIDVHQMLPMAGRIQHLTSPFSLTLRNDSVFSHLPFFGRAYAIPFGGGQGLTFEGKRSDYSVRFVNNEKANVFFRVRTKEDTFVFRLEIFSNGSSSIRVNSNNRQSISFHGDLEINQITYL